MNITSDFDFYLVNNNLDIHNEITNKYSNKFIIIEGDNSHYEFSGIQRCLDIIDKNNYSLFIICTDALFNFPINYLDLINSDIINYAIDNECCIGNIDSFLKKYQFDNFNIDYWIRTSFIILNQKLFEKINYKFITYEYSQLFDDNDILKIKIDPELDDFLRKWLKKDRYKYINNINIKKSCIFNEWVFTHKLIQHGNIIDYCNAYLIPYYKSIMTKNNKMVLLTNNKYVPYNTLIKIETSNWLEQIKLKNNLLA